MGKKSQFEGFADRQISELKAKGVSDAPITYFDFLERLETILRHVERQDILILRQSIAIQKFLGISNEGSHQLNRSYPRKTFVEASGRVFISKVATSATPGESSDWEAIDGLPQVPDGSASGQVHPSPKNAKSSVTRKRTKVLKHDEKGRILEFETTETPECEA